MKFLGSMVSSLTGVVLIEKIAYSRHIFGEINIPPSVPIQKHFRACRIYGLNISCPIPSLKIKSKISDIFLKHKFHENS